jgi:hypothetical protein
VGPFSRAAAACGIDRPRKKSRVTYRDGELVAYGNVEGTGELNLGEVESWYLGCRYYGEHTKGKDPDAARKYAFAATLEKFKGHKPRWSWREKAPRPPSPQQLRWIRSRHIRWAKGHRRAS